VVGRVNDLAKQRAALQGDAGKTASAIAEAQAQIAERKVQMAQVDFHAEVLTDLQTGRETNAELQQQRLGLEEQIRRLEILAPNAGIVHDSVLHTVGGVVSPGETLMTIVPQDDRLVVEVRVNPLDVDKANVTAELAGTVTQVSADLSKDAVTGAQYYSARISVPDAKLKAASSADRLLPGMPVEALLKTGDRTVLSYLLRPFTDQVAKAFREE
jgi:HlyD family secretion protein